MGSALQKNDILQGTLSLLVLRTLASNKRLHGYAITRRLGELSDEWFSVDEGSLYPCLYRMEKKGWIQSEIGRSENNRRARFYSLTARGRQRLKAEESAWRDYATAVFRVLEPA